MRLITYNLLLGVRIPQNKLARAAGKLTLEISLMPADFPNTKRTWCPLDASSSPIGAITR